MVTRSLSLYSNRSPSSRVSPTVVPASSVSATSVASGRGTPPPTRKTPPPTPPPAPGPKPGPLPEPTPPPLPLPIPPMTPPICPPGTPPRTPTRSPADHAPRNRRRRAIFNFRLYRRLVRLRREHRILRQRHHRPPGVVGLR